MRKTLTLLVVTRFVKFNFASDEHKHNFKSSSKNKTIPVTDLGGPYGCETSRLLHFLDNRLTDGGEVVSLTRRQFFNPQEDSWYISVRG
jgi:hypothetical protein